MSNRKSRQIKAAANIAQYQKEQEEQSKYDVKEISTDDKIAILEERGRADLVDLFKGWQPRVSNRKKRGAPLDQRVSITVTTPERLSLDSELKKIKSLGEKITMSQFIRNRALGTVDINGWRERADSALAEIDDAYDNQSDYRKEKENLIDRIESEDDEDVISVYSIKINEINRKLNKLVAQNEKRNNRLSGRMSMAEAETIKWRAQRLCISSSDYLRMMIFALEPDSAADSHMSLDAKRRFYYSIIEVAKNGWGTPPTVYECAQCENYMEEIRRLRDQVEALSRFA